MISVMLTTSGLSAQVTPQRDRIRPADFKSDGCSMFPDGNYRDCCEKHDLDYYFGGTHEERRDSDRKLLKCIQAKGNKGNKILAPIVWMGVRIGGHPIFPTPFRWGFGVKKKKPSVPKKEASAN